MADYYSIRLKNGGRLLPATVYVYASGAEYKHVMTLHDGKYPTAIYIGGFGGDVTWELADGTKIVIVGTGLTSCKLTVMLPNGTPLPGYNQINLSVDTGEYLFIGMVWPRRADEVARAYFYSMRATYSNNTFKQILPNVPTSQTSAIPYYELVPQPSNQTYFTTYSVTYGSVELWDLLFGVLPIEFPGQTSTETDPSNPTGGYIAGDYDDTSDPIAIPTAPVGSINLSMYHIYAPNYTQMNNFARWLWNDNGFDLTQLKKIFQNPIETILSLAQYPFKTSVAAETTENIVIGAIDSGQPAYEVVSQYIDIDCGNLKVNPYYGNALDYGPFTKLSMVLPYVGAVNIDPDEVMGKELNVTYRVDLLTGTFVAYVSIGEYDSTIAQKSVIYQFTGNMASQIPITQGSYIELAKTLMSVAGGLFSGVGAAASAGSISGVVSGAAAAANGISSGKSTVNHTGSLSCNAGFLGCRKPYIIKHIPRQCLPKEYGKIAGFPTNVYDKLFTFSGFTVVSDIHLEDIQCTKNEREAIDSLLQSGVIINANTNRTELPGLTLYVNGSENNTIYKQLTQVTNTTGYFRRSEDVETLILDVSVEGETFDYLYLEETGRYYFVRNRELFRDGLVRLTCECDVLESHAAEILALSAIVARNEKRFNLYINDTYFQTYQNPIIVTKEFPSGLTGEGYVLITAGGTIAV